MNSLLLPQGHGSFRPSFSASSLSPCTMRIPRLTLVSDGKPRRRLLIGSKKGIFKSFVAHDRAPSQSKYFETKNDSPRPKDHGESAQNHLNEVLVQILLLVCNPNRQFKLQSRRLDSHQHGPVYKTGAFLCRATSAGTPSETKVRCASHYTSRPIVVMSVDKQGIEPCHLDCKSKPRSYGQAH